MKKQKRSGKKKIRNNEIKTGKYIPRKEIEKSLGELKTDLEKIDYLKKILKQPEFLRDKTKEKAFEELGELYILIGEEREAGRAFINAGKKDKARECYQTSCFFTKKDEEMLKETEKELIELSGNKSREIIAAENEIKNIDDFSDLGIKDKGKL